MTAIIAVLIEVIFGSIAMVVGASQNQNQQAVSNAVNKIQNFVNKNATFKMKLAEAISSRKYSIAESMMRTSPVGSYFAKLQHELHVNKQFERAMSQLASKYDKNAENIQDKISKLEITPSEGEAELSSVEQSYNKIAQQYLTERNQYLTMNRNKPLPNRHQGGIDDVKEKHQR